MLKKVTLAEAYGLVSEDSRSNIVRLLKLPQWIADELHKVDTKNSFILARLFKPRFDAEVARFPWKKEVLLNKHAGRRFLVDWLGENGGGGQIAKLLRRFPNAGPLVSKAKDEAEARQILQTMIKKKVGVSGKLVMTCKDGMKWVLLTEDFEKYCPAKRRNMIVGDPGNRKCPKCGNKMTDPPCPGGEDQHLCGKCEGCRMQHCAHDTRGDLVSLRDDRDEPHVTMTWSQAENAIYQIKGKQNRLPVQKYWEDIRQFIQKTGAEVEDGEAKHNKPFMDAITSTGEHQAEPTAATHSRPPQAPDGDWEDEG